MDDINWRLNFYRAAAMQPRYSHEQNVRPSVERVNCDKTKKTSAYLFIPYQRSIILIFRQYEILGQTDPPL